MYKELLHLGPVTIYGYGLMIAIGIISCVGVAMKRAPKYGIDADILFNAAFLGIIAGIIAAKINYWITILPEIIENPKLMLDLNGGFVVYGGLIAGLLVPVAYLKAKKQTVMDKLDIAVASIALGQGFGRIGCFLAGCCYGKIAPEGAWYAVTFPANSDAFPTGIGLYPTQLMSAAFDFLLFFFLYFMTDRVRYRGVITSLYLMIYSVARFFIEFIRTEPVTVGPFTTAQFTAFIIFATGLILLIVMEKKQLPPLRKKAAGDTLPVEEIQMPDEDVSDDVDEVTDTVNIAEDEPKETETQDSTEEAVDLTEEPEGQEAPEASEESDSTEEPEGQEVPESSEGSDSTEETDSVEEPVSTEETAAPEEPDGTDVPEEPDEQGDGAPEEPETQPEPEAPENFETSGETGTPDDTVSEDTAAKQEKAEE